MSDSTVHPWIFQDATIKPVNDEDIVFNESNGNRLVLLWGPTGSGKSRFIEQLAGNDSLQISKDQLDSVTQKIATYEVIFTKRWRGPGTEIVAYQPPSERRMYILDTPGFSDSQISEIEIVEMLKDWMIVHSCTYIQLLLYFFPITDIRLSGTKLRAIQTMKLMTRINGNEPGAVCVVTTMWDRLWTAQSKRAAEERYGQLKDSVWKDLLDMGGLLTRFLNTHQSSFQILLDGWYTPQFKFGAFPLSDLETMRNTNFGPNLYQDLLTRIQNAQLQEQNLEIELDEAQVQTNEELKLLLEERLMRTQLLLTKLETQLVDFGEPPIGFESSMSLIQAITTRHHQQGGTQAAHTVIHDHRPTALSPASPSKFKRAIDQGIQRVKSKLRR